MAQPAQQLGPYEREEEGEGPQTRPKLGVIKGGGEGDGKPAGNLHSVGKDDKKKDEEGKGGKKGGVGSAGEALGKATDVVGKGFNPEGAAAKTAVQKLVAPLITGDKKKQGLIGGGIAAAIVLTGAI